MWEIQNHTPFECTGAFQRDHTGKSLWCVWIKTTFELRNGRPVLFTRQQRPLYQGPLFTNDDPEQPLLYDTDICLPKNRVDLLIAANPPAKPEPYLVGAKLGAWQKTLEVHPAASWGRWIGAAATDPAQAAPTSLGWSSASGGPQNPAGSGTYATKAEAQHQPCAQVFYPNEKQTSPTKPVRPASFAPVPRQWDARAQYAGTYDTAWQRTRSPILPTDFDTRYWQAAQADQTLDRDRLAGQTLSLANMGWPDNETFQTTIPDLKFDISVMFKRQWQKVDATLETIAIDLPNETMALTYITTFPINAGQNDIHVDQTDVTLSKSTGFSVLAVDAHLFDSANAGQRMEEPA